jgi:SOS-response transcriptional repressor LexA
VEQFELAGEIEHGEPLYVTAHPASLPPELVEEYELVYRIRFAPGFSKGDLLIVEPRNHASTGELVIAMRGSRVFIGRWWTKHGLKQVHVENGDILEGCDVAGAVNQIVRQ